jgi:cleavage and polyadenylation specificity factor subunit 4
MLLPNAAGGHVDDDNLAHSDAARQIVDHSAAPAFRFAFSDFLKREYRFGLDPNRPLCKAFLQGHCPLGNACPDRHTAAGTYHK